MTRYLFKNIIQSHSLMWHVESINDVQKQRPGKYAKEIDGMKPQAIWNIEN